MPEYRTYNDKQTLCCTVDELVTCGLSINSIWDGLKRHRQGIVTCWPHHKDGKVWLHYDGLREEYRNMLRQIICQGKDPHAVAGAAILNQYTTLRKEDHDAIELAILDIPQLSAKKKQMTDACRVLWLMKQCTNRKAMQKLLPFDTMKEFTEAVIHYIIGNKIDLPQNYARLKEKLRKYDREGAACVIKAHNYGNSHRLKVDAETEWILNSLYGRHDKPYYTILHGLYEDFRKGRMQLTDTETGEIISFEPFAGKSLGITTVYNWVNHTGNRTTVDKVRTEGLEYGNVHRPHIHRHSPQWSFSKITIDDIDIPFKMKDGTRVKAYEIWDVASGAVIGRAYSKEKKTTLMVDALRNMFRLIVRNGWKMPHQIETERHLAWDMKGKETENGFEADIFSTGALFPFVEFCLGGNPKQKRAEHNIRGKKYQLQNKREGFQRRPFARLESNRLNKDRDKVTYTYEQICANEDQDIETWNAMLHPDQKKYPGMTRWDVLTRNQNPELNEPAKHVMALYVGYATETSVRNSQYVKVRGRKYMLPDPEEIKKLKRVEVSAYYLDKNPEMVYLYQDKHYICACDLLETFNEAAIEQTDRDREIMQKQFSYRAKFDKMVKENVGRMKSLDIARGVEHGAWSMGKEETMDEYDQVPVTVTQIREEEVMDEYDKPTSPSPIRQEPDTVQRGINHRERRGGTENYIDEYDN